VAHHQDRIDYCVLCAIDIVTIIVTAIIVLIIAGMLIFPADAGECLGSAREVRVWAHGMTAWSTWRNIDGQKCYMLGRRKEVVRSEYRGSVRSASAGLSRHEITPRPSTPAGAIPLPRPRLEGMITPHLSYEQEAAMWRALLFEQNFGPVGSR